MCITKKRRLVMLTFEKTGGKKRWREQSFAVIAAPKIGKSELFADDRTIYLDVEGGLNHLDVFKFPKERPFKDFDDLENVVDQLVALKQEGKFPADKDTIVLDTATRFTQLLDEKVLALLNAKHPGKDWEAIESVTVGGDKGNPGWKMRSNLADSILGKLKQLGCCVVIIAHMETKKVKNDSGIDIDKQTIDIGGQLGKAYLRYSDHILNIIGKMGTDGIITRTVRALPSASVEAGSRGMCVEDGWVLTNPKVRTKEAMAEASKANYAKLRSWFID